MTDDYEASMLSYYLEACVLMDREQGSCDNLVEIEAMAMNALAIEASDVRTKVCNYRGTGRRPVPVLQEGKE